MNIALGSDHAGLAVKNDLLGWLRESGYEPVDCGPDLDGPVDYPDFAVLVVRKIIAGVAAKGILVCGSGIGMCMAANRFPAIRAAVLRDSFDARMSREHNDCNVACLGARRTDAPTAKALLEIWLKTQFAGGRHARRVVKIDELAQH